MKFMALGLVLLATGAIADTQATIDDQLARGEKSLEAARGAEGTKLLRALEAAKPHFRRARALAERRLEGAPGDAALAKAKTDATLRLVGILNAETAIYLNRGSRSLAGRRNGEALALLPQDARAKAFEAVIADPAPYEFDAQIVDVLLGSGQAGKPVARHEADRRASSRR